MTDELPIAKCDLDPPGLTAQRERYRQLANSVTGLERRPGRLLVWFRPDVDAALLEETLAVERRCCPFFQLEFEPSERRLEIGVDRAERARRSTRCASRSRHHERRPAYLILGYSPGEVGGPATRGKRASCWRSLYL